MTNEPTRSAEPAKVPTDTQKQATEAAPQQAAPAAPAADQK